MPSPISPDDLKALIPRAGGPLCGKLIPGMINYMQAVADHFAWMYKPSGELSPDFVADICSLDCVANCGGTGGGGGGGGGGVVTCPIITLIGTVTPKHEQIDLAFSGANMVAGYAYEIFRKAAPGDPYVSIATGTTTGSNVNYSDTGLTNGTLYYYKLTVQKPTCPAYSLETTGTPTECRLFSYYMSAASNAPGEASLRIKNANGFDIEDGFLLKVYLSDNAGAIGAQIESTTTGDVRYACTIDGKKGICFPWASLDPSKVWYFTVTIQEKVGCTESSMRAAVRPLAFPLATPVLATNGAALVWPVVQNAAGYLVYRRAIGDCLSYDFTLFRSIPSPATGQVTVYFDSQWPCTSRLNVGGVAAEGITPSRCTAQYEIYVVAVGVSGNQSPNSNVVSAIFVRSGTC